MQKKEDSVHQFDQPISNSPKWIKNLTMIIISVLLLTMFGLGSYWLSARRQQTSPPQLLTTPKPSRLPFAPPVQRLSTTPTIPSSQTNPTANWKTYRNEKYGFELQYPPDFEEYGYTKRSDSFAAQSYKTRYGIFFSVVIGYSSLQGYLAELDGSRATAYEGDPSVQILQRYNTNVAGYPAVQQEIVGLTSTLPEIETFTDLTPKMIVQIAARGITEDGFSDSLRQLHQQVLSTFRVIGNL